MIGEDVGLGDRLAQPAAAHEDDVVLTSRAQDPADLADQGVDAVAHSALAEGAEPRQIAADLRRIDVGVLADLMRGDRAAARLLGLG